MADLLKFLMLSGSLGGTPPVVGQENIIFKLGDNWITKLGDNVVTKGTSFNNWTTTVNYGTGRFHE
jgi:hypothetical protein